MSEREVTLMNIGQEKGVVLYIRVSTAEQASDPYNLPKQKSRCEDYCKQKNLLVVETFVDPGESARSADRPEFQRMLQFCKTHRREVGYVVVQDLSRFARNLADQAHAINVLRQINVLVRSTYETNVDETAAGKLAANIFGSFNQYSSDALSEKMQDRTRQAVAAGRFPWGTPVGYVNIGGKEGANIRPDPVMAPLVRRAFELMATGNFKKTEVLRIITDEGLRTKKNAEMKPQTFQMMLRNPLYAGWVVLRKDPDSEPVRGLHEPIVPQELFDQVQAILDGRKVSAAPKRKFNPAVPLTRFVKCAVCGTPLAGGECGGRSKDYRHYWCREPGCRAVKLRAEKLEAEFVTLLRRLEPDEKVLSELPTIAAKVWATKLGDVEKETRKLNTKIEELRKLKAALLRKNLNGTVTDSEYREAKSEFDAEISTIEDELRLFEASRAKSETFVKFAELMVADIAQAWEIAGPEQQQRVQNLLFGDGLAYSKESGFLNRSKSSLFKALEGMTDQNLLLASPTGFEPVLSP
jgi:site-specific DNA recombinase